MGDALPGKKKLLILCLGRVLCDRKFMYDSNKRVDREADTTIGNFLVYRRPYCEEFLKICFDNFTVGLWSAAMRHNEVPTVNYLFGKLKNKLAFEWHQSNCTSTESEDPENNRKPVFLKDLSNVWETHTPDLLKDAHFGPSNTVLIENTPYPAIRNQPNTALFISKYSGNDVGDAFLKDELQPYLKRLEKASNVQSFIKENPFGNSAFNSSSPYWTRFKHLINPESPCSSNPYKTKEEEIKIVMTDLLSRLEAMLLHKEHKSEGKSLKAKAVVPFSTGKI